ncbi:MAG: quinone-dependent dihydroorotate dehydrogenase [Burkholderiales bacterium]|nr:quinone-dependent dihydroorotate dehydrogenase [Burkholderiales bacterium]
MLSMTSYDLLRPLLFAADPESAHRLALGALARLHRLGLVPATAAPHACAREAMGIRFPNPVGLAAGLDKNGECIDGLAALGFGYIEIGTVTPRPQPGNPRPRLFRLPPARALINRLGFNNDGADRLVENVRNAAFRGVLGINIGKNADTPIERAADDYLACLRKVYPLASYVTVNISSPNTQRLRELQGSDELDRLLGALKREQRALAQAHGRHVPLVVKIAPDLAAEEIGAIAGALRRHGIEGAIATNTTLAREGVEGLPHGSEAGGLSGAPLAARSSAALRALAEALAGEVPVIGVGGIMSGADAREKVAAGASLVQVYTGLIYRGPGLVGECVAALCERRDEPPIHAGRSSREAIQPRMNADERRS